MKTIVDARGMACPQPVVLTARALVGQDTVTTIVDNRVAVENVTRLARAKGFQVHVRELEDGFYLALARDGAIPEVLDAPVPLELISCQPAAAGPAVIFSTSTRLGEGPAELGERLMAAFFHTLQEVCPLPSTIVLMNTGVRLAVEGSRCLDDLKDLTGKGVELLVCGACLGFFELTDRLAVGQVSNMYDIAQVLLGAGKVVRV